MFIQMFQGRCHQPDQVRDLVTQWREELAADAPGWLGGTFGFTEDDTFIAVVRFESRDDAAANASRPEQQQWWSEVEACFEGPIEFHDCSDVTLMFDGGSDDAGFVQIIQGKVQEPERLKAAVGDMEDLRRLRPEILGATLAIEPDGTFIQTVAFTDEARAREGERQEIPSQAQGRWEDLVQDVTFRDLHDPWFSSPAR